MPLKMTLNPRSKSLSRPQRSSPSFINSTFVSLPRKTSCLLIPVCLTVTEKLTLTLSFDTDLPNSKARCSPKRKVARFTGTKSSLFPHNSPLWAVTSTFKFLTKIRWSMRLLVHLLLNLKTLSAILMANTSGRTFMAPRWTAVVNTPTA